MMMSVHRFFQFFEMAIVFVIVTMVLFPKLVGLSFALWILVLVLGLFSKNVVFVKPGKISMLIAAFFFAYLIGTAFTNNPDIALKYVEYKASFLLIPGLFLFLPREKIRIELFLNIFLVAVIILGIYSLWTVARSAYPNFSFSAITSTQFSTVHHPTYFSAYAFFAMLIGVKVIFEGSSSKKLWVWYGLVFYLIAIQLLCLSLAGLLFLFIFLGFLAIYLAKRKFGTKGFVVAIVMAPLLVLLVMRFVPGVMTQLQVSKLYATEYLKDPSEFVRSHKTYIGGNETRLIMWTASAQEIAEHPFGVGTGNVDDHLEARLISLGHLEMSKKMYNPHNQYLQTGLEIGMIGLGVLLAIIIVGILQGIKTRNWLLVFIALSLGFNCLFESMLQRQSGIVFYTFWMVLVAIYFSKQEATSAKTKILE